MNEQGYYGTKDVMMAQGYAQVRERPTEEPLMAGMNSASVEVAEVAKLVSDIVDRLCGPAQAGLNNSFAQTAADAQMPPGGLFDEIAASTRSIRRSAGEIRQAMERLARVVK